ncbi:MAG TPA: alpha-(1-_3)-arabinofuranosyltransferase family protein [Streptosporangiaceae bacterium]|nr:alpha-(1->3)-arabinofuranosyltransferase family protein [Streptosporangiaceae bacterium]
MTARERVADPVVFWPGSSPGRRPVLRWSALVFAGAFVVLLANDPGRMFFDTKLSVDLNPWAYYASLWHLMNPLNTFGALNNQAVGYAVPMAPFYLAGQLAHVPVWLTERLWLALIIAAGFAGLAKLAEALGIGSPASRFLAGLVFALWPTFTIVIGSTSSAALPGMLAPWAVLPLVRGRSVIWSSFRSSFRSVVWPAVRSGAVVLGMSGINATVTIDALLLPGLFILVYTRGRRLVALALCWAGAVVLATAWWALPLLLQGRYAFNFLPYIEQSVSTTGTMSAAATLRGAGNWTAYLNLGTPWLPAGWALVSTPMAIIAAAVAAGVGLYGLASRNLPYGGWLRLCFGVAAAFALAGYGGALGGPFHGFFDQLLNGALAPFRNVYKLEPVLAAVLALGVAHAVAGWLVPAPSRRLAPSGRLARSGRLVRSGRLARSGRLHWVFALEGKAAAGLVLVGLMLPYLSGQVLNPGSFSAVPRYWYQVAAFLAARSPLNTALVVPADAHGDYLWGDPIDDPLVALASSPWAQAGLVPYGGAGSQILLDTVEHAIESGEQVSGLAGYLSRAGVRYLVVRNDLDPRQVGYTAAALVHQTLALSGFTRVAAFGALIGGAQIEPRATRAQQEALPSYPAVEVYSFGSSPLSPVTALPVSQTVLVNGGPDSLLQLTGQGLLGAGQPAVIAGDSLPVSPPAVWAVTDGQRREDTLFGLVNANVSYTYTATETNPARAGQLGRAGGPPRQLLPVPASGHLTVADLSGAAGVTASSYGSWIADTQQDDPVNAFDGNPATAWAEGNELSPVGQWIQINFDRPLDLPASVGIRLLDDSTDREIARVLRVSTAAGTATTAVAATGAVQPLRVAPGRTGWLRIEIARAARVQLAYPGAGISDVLIPGVAVTRLLQPASDPTGASAPSVAFSFHQQVPSPFPAADPAATAPMARSFTVASPAAFGVQATALALPGAGLDALLSSLPERPGPGVLEVSVASTPGAEPAGFPASLISGSARAPWTADTASPVIHLRWQGKRSIGSLIVRPAAGLPSTPLTVKITSPDGTREASIGAGGLVRFAASLTTDRIDVSFPRVRQATIVSLTGQLETLPLRLSRLSVPALAGLRAVTPAGSVSLACGQGPALTVDGRVYQTSVSGTLGELSQYRPLQVRLCAPGGALSLGAGRHTLVAATPGTFAVTDLSLTSGTAAASAAASSAAAPPAAGRPVTVASWQPDQARLTIGRGAASYLEVHENFNLGWTAALNGQRLTPVRLDGWQQGFVVPAGAGGTITLTFRPAATYHVALIASLVAVVLLLALAAWSFTRRGSGPGTVGSGTVAPTGRERPWIVVTCVTVLMVVAGGVVALAVPVLILLGRRVRLPVVAFGAMAASGLLAAIRPFGAGLLGPFGWPAQACALVALAAALIAGSLVAPGGSGTSGVDREDG